ncbi:nucleotidyltransferase domain-containing protein [Paraliomyxa miuraensis]|uniref:nucleotidyltransferase domain-containing protein n=1 Tax=Paraliomyxa miuraensis TaxID=376150 RepID=UPI00225C09EF|nr:nucleotidyltransferase domain-containing protein [Paraliomyxa miuraensis]MCX4247808.1 nucleotidyltransferase domain-containing protein [Paraliomyxa miuraensis]
MDGSSDSADAPPTTATRAPAPAKEGAWALVELQRRLGVRWEKISRARDKTEEIVATLRAELRGLEDPNCSVIVTGSLGRGEADEGSDCDWFLLVDGPSDPQHARLAREIGTKIRSVVSKDVGPTGTFGEIVASHDLVHRIAGSDDTNKNLTRRMLLLAESRALSNDVVRERVIRNVLARYLYDRPVSNKRKPGRYDPIPYFLLNDVVRYWRTVASDYASKMWERTYHGWGIRNIKLRFSRKMLFVWGLLAAFSGRLFDDGALAEASSEDEFLLRLLELIRSQTDVPPLELLARAALAEGVRDETITQIFSNYDEFLGALADPDTRRHLETVPFDDGGTDSVYEGLRQPSWLFRSGINDLFFKEHPLLPELILKFVVF